MPAARDNNIVQAFMSPAPPPMPSYEQFKPLSDKEKEYVIREEAERYNIVRPKGTKVSFHYNPDVEYHHFGSSHPMKPWRLTLTKQLIFSYGLEYAMDCHKTLPASPEEIAIFHDREYVDFLRRVTPTNMHNAGFKDAVEAFGFAGETNDCPVFDGIWNYVSLYSGASVHAAHSLISGQSDIAINWSGGLHHAKKKAASGFCYVNDIVMAIIHLLQVYQRVLYIDIDVHHGDGVEQAFESTDRVFTLSYHKYHPIDFFPGTGNIDEMGPTDPSNRGKGHALNIPLQDGISDQQYTHLFRTVTGAVIQKYQPEAILLQCGADSLGGDRLGSFNLNVKAHGACVEFVKQSKLPLILVGGGGYTPRNVARTWCHETAVCVDVELHNELPAHVPFIQAFQGSENGGGLLYPNLHNIRGKEHHNNNTTQSLHDLTVQALENLRYLEGAPSVAARPGLPEHEIMRLREEVEREIQEEIEEKERAEAEALRRKRERNTGGRLEHRFR